MKIHYMGAVAQELSGRDADVNVVSNQQMQLTMAAAGRIPVEQCRWNTAISRIYDEYMNIL